MCRFPSYWINPSASFPLHLSAAHFPETESNDSNLSSLYVPLNLSSIVCLELQLKIVMRINSPGPNFILCIVFIVSSPVCITHKLYTGWELVFCSPEPLLGFANC